MLEEDNGRARMVLLWLGSGGNIRARFAVWSFSHRRVFLRDFLPILCPRISRGARGYLTGAYDSQHCCGVSRAKGDSERPGYPRSGSAVRARHWFEDLAFYVLYAIFAV